MMIELMDGDVGAERGGCAQSVDLSTAKRRRRRRGWSNAEKRAMVELANQPGSSVSEVARTFDVSTSRLYGWRRQIAAGELGEDEDASPVFARVEVREPVPERRLVPDCVTATMAGRIVVDFPSGVQVRIDGIVDPAALEVVLAELGH